MSSPLTPTRPTAFAELNGVLADLVANASRILGDNLVGAYLQGSFAVGDGDRYSDCDFLIAVQAPLTAKQEAGLRALHDHLPTWKGHWTRHLEGSYPLLADLRSLDGLGREWLYVDHGWREMQWSTHCNTEVARWSLRERGVVLTGPPPSSFMEPIPADAIRARMRQQIPNLVADITGWISLDVGWGQRYLVTTVCRMLYSLASGEVTSKKGALRWASEELDPPLASAARPSGRRPVSGLRPPRAVCARTRRTSTRPRRRGGPPGGKMRAGHIRRCCGLRRSTLKQSHMRRYPRSIAAPVRSTA